MFNESCLEQIGLNEYEVLKDGGQKIVYKAISNDFGNVAVKVCLVLLSSDFL